MMSQTKTIDARGLSCPQPAMLARQAINQLGKGTVEILVDSVTARENISRLAQNCGWSVTVDYQPEGDYRIILTK